MEYRVLGTLEVRRDGEPVDLGAFRQRAMLAMLLTAPNSIMSTDHLIDGLWGENGDGDRQNSLWVYVSGLRKALEPDREKRSEGTILLTRSPGYTLQIEPDEIDSVRFERMVAEGRALAETDPAAASVVFGEALALWRGRAFEEFTYEGFAQSEIARLEALRLETVEARIDADLDRGLSRELISELETLTREHPLQERMTGQLMLALYRSGRQADALRAYRQLRSRLGSELGIEPSAAIRRLEEQIVTGDPALDSGASTSLPGSGPQSGLAVRGYELREELGERSYGTVYRAYQPAVGREVAMKVIPAELANDPDFIRRFETEAQIVARLEHPHIVPLYDYWREPDAAYLVMRLLKGGTLAALLRERALAHDEASRMLEQVGSALEAAHRVGVLHRDGRPENILIDDEGNAYLSDFGIAVGADSPALVGPAGSTPAFASPELLTGDDASAAADVYSLGVVMAQALTGLKGEIQQVRGALQPSALAVIDRATAPAAEDRYDGVAEFVVALRSVLIGDAAMIELDIDRELDNPYKGLRAFDAADADEFYGRERLIDRLVARLGERGTHGRFVAVVGPSGSGKSSVVRAGVLPALRNGALPMSDQWFTVAMTPAPHPFEALEEALLGIAIDPPASLLEQIAGENGLQRALTKVMPNDGSQLVLVIDQFEELFTQVDADTANRFLDILTAAVQDPHSRMRVVTTLRADFYDRPLRHRGVGELVRDGTEAITPLTAEELERAITAPATALGVIFEPAVVAELVRDVIDRAGALPLLQYTLTELFDARDGNRITDAAYQELGGVSGALVERADGLLARLGDHAHDTTRQVFLRLVTLGEGADDTRRRVLRTELEQLSVDQEILDGVLDTFGRHRLLSFDRDPVTRSPTVEISHEALLTEWTRLRDWIDGARHDVRNQRRLAEAMGEWVGEGRDDAYLLRGGRLEQLNGWARGTTLPLSEPEQAFLAASVAERDRAEVEEQERETRAEEAERQAQRRSRQLAIAGVVGAVVAALAIFGIVQWRSASDARDDNQALVTAEEFRAASDAALSEDPELALLYAVEAVKSTADLGFATEEAVDSLHWSLQRIGVQFPVGADARTAVRSGPTGLTGVFLLPPADLVGLAEEATARQLTDDECASAIAAQCPAAEPIPADLPLRFGVENYRVDVPEVLPGRSAFGDGPLAGTRVTVANVGTLAFSRGAEAELRVFSERTGIQVDLLSNLDFGLTAMLSTGQVDSVPDIAGFFQPAEPWAQERAVDLSLFLDEERLRLDFGDYLIDLLSNPGPDGTELHGLPMNFHPKGLVLYPKPAFDAAGYEIPETWDELIALSEQMVEDGHDPWCFQWEAGFASGFLGSDYLEAMITRSAGIDVYDEWVAGERAFDDPEIVAAAKLGEEILFGPDFVRGGPESITSGGWGLAAVNLLELDPFTGEAGPRCFFVTGQSQYLHLLGADTDIGPGGRPGQDVDFFMLPPVDGDGPAPVTGGGLIATAMTDRPEIRELMRFMASPEWGEIWASLSGEQGDTFLSANWNFDTAAYHGIQGPDTGLTATREDAEVLKRLHWVQIEALQNDTWRYDGSDLMPTTFAAWTADFDPGPFWQGMVDWVDQKKPIEEILADIEAARPPPGS